MNHNTDPGTPDLQSDLHFEHYGARIYLYNTQAIAMAEPGTSLRLYENTELKNGFAAVALETKVELTDGGPVLTMQLGVQLPTAENRLEALGRLQKYVESDRVGRGYTTLDTSYGNVVRLNLGMDVEALAWFNEQKGELFVSNNVQLGTSEDGHGPVIAHPVLLERLGANLQLMMVSQFMAELLGYGATDYGQGEYHIGKQIEPLSPTMRADLGGAALSAETEVQPSALSTDEETATERDSTAGVDHAVRLDDWAGDPELKQTVRDVVLSFRHAKTMAQWGVRRPQGILLHGPPGTGKSMLVQALANEIGAELRKPQSSDIYGKWLGESEENVKRFFDELRKVRRPTIVLFDELETIINSTRKSSSRSGADSAWNAVAGIVKQELDTLARENPFVLLAATTNNLDAIDESLIRPGRFDHVYEVGLPTGAALEHIFHTNITRLQRTLESDTFKMFAPDIDALELARAAESLSGAAVVEILRRLRFARAMRHVRTGEVVPISQADVVQAISELRKAAAPTR